MLITVLLALSTTPAWAGPTEHVGKELTKGVGAEVKKEVGNIDLRKGAKDVSSGVVDGLADHRSQIDKGARDLGRAMAQGFFLELRSQLGTEGKGPLAKSMADAGELGARQLIHGVAEEVTGYLPACQGADRASCLDALVQRYAYESSRAAARGAAAGAPPWPTFLFAAAGFVAGVLGSAIVALLFGQRRSRREMQAALRPRTI
ncbi:MAG: hypothetical protein JWN44_2856 [Myxococcales bacterium]|nr:hypothetical protein [Myxococcales bacterium]